MIDATLLSTLAIAIGAGLATFFSPCAYPLLPGYVGYYANHASGGTPTLGGSVVRGAVAGGGVIATFGVLFGLSFVIGYDRLSGVTIFEYIVGVVLLGFGLLVVFDRAPSLSIALPKRRSSVLGFGIFGAGYALAAAGCVAPIFIGVLTRALSLSPPEATLLLGTYVGSVTVLMVATTIATGVGLSAGAGWLRARTGLITRLAGVIMILAGLGQLYLAMFVDVF